jgi:hypothetical protein
LEEQRWSTRLETATKRCALALSARLPIDLPLCVYSSLLPLQLNPDELLIAISRPLFITYASISLFTIFVLAYLSRTRLGDKWVMIDLSLCALTGSFTVLSTKAISGFINLDPWLSIRSWITWVVLLVLAVTAVVQVAFVNKARACFLSPPCPSC